MKTSGKKEAQTPWATLVASFADDPEVELPAEERGAFGSNGLKVQGRIFAMDRRGDVVVKLPAARVEALVASGKGLRLEMGSRSMKEWLVLLPPRRGWAALVDEARAFVVKAASPGARAASRPPPRKETRRRTRSP
jgi:hypothetical protein